MQKYLPSWLALLLAFMDFELLCDAELTQSSSWDIMSGYCCCTSFLFERWTRRNCDARKQSWGSVKGSISDHHGTKPDWITQRAIEPDLDLTTNVINAKDFDVITKGGSLITVVRWIVSRMILLCPPRETNADFAAITQLVYTEEFAYFLIDPYLPRRQKNKFSWCGSLMTTNIDEGTFRGTFAVRWKHILVRSIPPNKSKTSLLIPVCG